MTLKEKMRLKTLNCVIGTVVREVEVTPIFFTLEHELMEITLSKLKFDGFIAYYGVEQRSLEINKGIYLGKYMPENHLSTNTGVEMRI